MDTLEAKAHKTRENAKAATEDSWERLAYDLWIHHSLGV
jgi:hypothetical protein